MPKRTNDFQELVALIERVLAPCGAKVTESAEIKVDGLETLREVDVLIEGQFGPYAMKVAVEARGSDTRKMSIQVFDSFVAKYRGECRVLVDKVVLVSQRGFTKGIIEKARKLDVELLTLTEARTIDWMKVVPRDVIFSVPPHICRITFEPTIPADQPKELWQEARMVCPQGHDHGTPIDRATRLVFQGWFRKHPEFVRNVEQQVRESPHGQCMVEAGYPFEGWIVRFRGREFAISLMTVGIHFVCHKGAATHRVYQRQSSKSGPQTVHHIEALAGGKRISVVMPGGPEPPKRIVVRFGEAARADKDAKAIGEIDSGKAEKA